VGISTRRPTGQGGRPLNRGHFSEGKTSLAFPQENEKKRKTMGGRIEKTINFDLEQQDEGHSHLTGGLPNWMAC